MIRININSNRNMRKIVVLLFLFSMVTSKSFLIETKEDPKADESHDLDYSLPKKQRVLKKYNKKCKDQFTASKSGFCQKWIIKWLVITNKLTH